MKRAEGLTITEVLVAMLLVLVMATSVSPMLTATMSNNSSSRTRSSALSAAETWIERYRSGQEPLDTVGPCVEVPTGKVTCTYAYDHSFSGDTGIPSHVSDAANLKGQFERFRSVLEATPVSSGSNLSLWELKVQVFWKEKEEKSVTVYTRFTR
ncbi:hypothetical protein [Deinococcus aquaedulcis]|uniref:hypothetical protein n=1 Tax=Deinococcus aquaedulcis TaxID=2840455 RepID=UPI001C831D53|nr:hypothetical protein [Deinococcus aquaedulcis]